MTKLLWDQPGAHGYETGLSKGVLYLSDGTAVAWNGLRSVEENLGDEGSDSVYIDGLKYAEGQTYGDFSATLTAFTFPDEFLEYDGVTALGGGIFADAQNEKRFGLCYRTEVSDDLGTPGYKLHVVFNALALTDTRTYQTIGEQTDPSDFSWTIVATPAAVTGFRPTAHLVIDSRYTKSYILSLIENTLYGTDTTAPSLPSLQALVNLILAYSVIYVIDNGDGTITIKGPDSLIYQTADSRVWQIDHANAVVVDANTYAINDTKDI